MTKENTVIFTPSSSLINIYTHDTTTASIKCYVVSPYIFTFIHCFPRFSLFLISSLIHSYSHTDTGFYDVKQNISTYLSKAFYELPPI